MPGEIYAFITVLCWSIGIFPFTEAARRLGTATLNQYRLLLAWLILTVILVIFYPLSIPALFTRPVYMEYVYFGLSGIIGFTIGDYCAFASFKILGPKLGSLYTTFAPGSALVFGYLFIHESINAAGMAGIGITLAGVIWLTLSKKDKAAAEDAGFERNVKGILLGLAGALCQGTGLVLSKVAFGLEESAGLVTMHAVWIRLLFAFGAAFVVSALGGRLRSSARPILANQGNGLPYLVAGTLLGPVCGVTLSLMAIQQMPVAAAQTIFALLPIVVLPLNYFYYREKITAQAVFACLLAFVGVVLLIYRDSF